MKQNEIKISNITDEEVMQELNQFLNHERVEKVRYNLLSKGIIIVKFVSEEKAKSAMSKISS